MRVKLNLSFALFSIICFNAVVCFSQTTTRPSFSINGNPANDGICVSPSAPNREAFALANRNFPVGTEFILEVSNPDGSFPDDPVVLSSFSSDVELDATNNRNINFPSFPIPTDLRGDDYALRLRYIIPGQAIQTGNTRTNLYIYNYNNDQEIVLSGPNPNTSVVALCEGETTDLTVIPSDFPEYEWTYNGSIIAGESGPVLENVSQPGTYRVKALFGFCNNFFDDDESEVTVVNFNPTTVNILQAPVVDFCPSDIKLLECSINASGLVYEWFKDGVLLENQTTGIIELPQSNFAGVYSVTVTGTESCFITTDQVQVNNLGSDILTQPPSDIILLPNQPSIVLEVTTNAPDGSTAQWFRNGIEVTPLLSVNDPGALQFEVVSTGVYRVDIIANDACGDTLQAETNVTTATSLSLSIDNVISCEDSTGTASITEFVGISSTGEEIPLTEDQLSLFEYQWFRNGEIINENGTSISLTEADLNQTFALEATIMDGSLPAVRSNDLLIQFINSLTIEASALSIPFGGTVTLSVPDIIGYTYEWFFDDQLIEGASSSQIEITENGIYFVRITNEECSIDSEPINIGGVDRVSGVIPNVITPGGNAANNDWILPSELTGEDTEVTIYTPNGEVDFQQTGYNGEWPGNSSSQMDSILYYYIIKRNNSIIRKGTITVIR